MRRFHLLYRLSTAIIFPSLSLKISRDTSLGNVKPIVTAITWNYKPYRKCITVLWRSIAIPQVRSASLAPFPSMPHLNSSSRRATIAGAPERARNL